MLRGDLHQIVSEGERLHSQSRPLLVDEAQELLGVAGHGADRRGMRHGYETEDGQKEDHEGSRPHSNGVSIDLRDAEATRVDCHYR